MVAMIMMAMMIMVVVSKHFANIIGKGGYVSRHLY